MRTAVAVWTVASLVSLARAELKPEEIVILAIKDSEASRQVAEHYAKARGISEARILLLDLKPGADVSRADFDAKVKPAVKSFLADKGLTDKIRCLVTVFDMPLRVGQQTRTPAEQARSQELGRRIDANIDEMTKIAGDLYKLAGDEGKAQPPANRPDAKAALTRFQEALAASNRFVNSLEDAKKPQARAALDQAFVRVGGLQDVLRVLRQQAAQPAAPEQVRAQFHQVQGELRGLEMGLRAINAIPDSPEKHQQAEILLARAVGLNGVIGNLQQTRETLGTRETEASFENELALMYWDAYPLYRWQMNPLHHRFDNVPEAQKPKGRVLMTARLEAPTLERTLKMIDTAIEVEKKGLSGKFYIDARGLKADPTPGTYGDYDETLRRLADLLKQKTNLEVVLDDRADLFAVGACPDAALYCGWYSLANYVDSFTWVPGAVGYHIASSEAITLRDPKSKVWCKRMLELGVTATMGPVAEPYLNGFPRPDEFFPLLLTGKFTLAECFHRTSNFNSWMTVLVGDPLYRPFAAKPALSVDDLPGKLAPPK